MLLSRLRFLALLAEPVIMTRFDFRRQLLALFFSPLTLVCKPSVMSEDRDYSTHFERCASLGLSFCSEGVELGRLCKKGRTRRFGIFARENG